VQEEAWLNQDHDYRPGRELFRSERSFALWAYTVSHSQLLLRTRTVPGQRRIDVLFKPVESMKIRADYDGLVIRCATPAECQEIFAGPGSRLLILESAGQSDYVITGAFGWRQDDGGDHEASALAYFPPGSDPARILP